MMPQRKLLRPYLADQIVAFVNSAHNDIDRLCADHSSKMTALICKAAEHEREITALMHDNADLREDS